MANFLFFKKNEKTEFEQNRFVQLGMKTAKI